jgi:hypothetical protein
MLATEIQIFGVLQSRGIPVVCNVVFALLFRPPQFRNVDCVGGFRGVANIGQLIIPFTLTTIWVEQGGDGSCSKSIGCLKSAGGRKLGP